jgi:internalin A
MARKRNRSTTRDSISKPETLVEKALRERAKKLDLSGRGLTELPETIERLTEIEELDLSRNELTDLPEFLGVLTSLEKLNLGGNRLGELPESVGQLAQLRWLNLYDNQLSYLPKSIAQLTQLEGLSLQGNRLTRLPESIGQLTQLQTLFLQGNRLTRLTGSIGKLTQLETLFLHFNHLAQLPESIGHLTHLQTFFLQGNQMTHLPESIGKLTQLRGLYLSQNQLEQLPESIVQLSKLKTLDLTDNILTALLSTLKDLTSLEALYLHGNEGLGLPTEVLGARYSDVAMGKAKPARPTEILEYYFRVKAEKRPLNEAKLILVGRGGVGKTSLVKRLVERSFDRDEKKTEGINITRWDLRLHANEQVRLNVWDFGGQEIMHATHQFFMTQRSLYLLVLNGRQGGEDADADYWLRLIESFGEDSPVIVVLNKIKEQPFDLNRRALQQKYTSVREFIKTDCEDGTGCDDLQKMIERETDRLPHLRDAFPASWFAIKDELAGTKKNYLRFDQYRDACARLGETDPKAQEALAYYLHSLGIALNYKDDPRLKDTHVLNPHWVTNGIYKIVNSETLEKQKGEIKLNQLAGLLDAIQYPSGMHRFLMDLMKKFELCFSFPDDDTHYLIPELLDKQQPPEAEEFLPEDCLSFEYHYPILPEGLLPRFIVRTHSLSEGLARWRTGVILGFEGCRALVKADASDKKVLIQVSGPGEGRRRLLAVIRSDFERIHHDIRNLEPLEMVPLPEHPSVLLPYNDLQVREQNGIALVQIVVGKQIVEADVSELLNGVDLKGARRKEEPIGRTEPVLLFYSYSHKDESLRDELETQLKILQRQGSIDNWHDRKIEAGDDWKVKIDENLERAGMILLLISPDFIASDYCYEIEMKRALERQRQGEARVIPVILRDTNWKSAPFAKLQALPKDGKAITTWANKDSAWRNVSEGIEHVAR